MTVKVQLSGVLFKRPFGHQSTKWSKRYFIIKDGFLLYYHETEKKEIEKRQLFNIHPKGIIPLGGCEVESGTEPGHPYVIYIKSQEISSAVAMAAENEFDHEKWVEILRQSTRITWDNALLGDSMIKQLEAQGLQMAKEKQNYFDQLQSEAKALHDEQQKTEELEHVREELEKEKEKMESLTQELREQYLGVKLELEETVVGMKTMEEDRHYLQEAKLAMQDNLSDLAKEKERTLEELALRQNEALKLTKEKQNLSEVTESLRKTLKSIEDQTHKISEEQHTTEERLKENLQKSQQMEQEKLMIVNHVQQLEASIKDLSAQKAITEAELKEEIVARMEAERRLQEAEASLKRLDVAVNTCTDDTRNQETVQEEMKSDVKTLKKFFENLAFESKLDSDKPIMIKNSIHARKTMVNRAMTMRYQASKRSRKKGAGRSGRALNTMSVSLPHHAHLTTDEFNNNNNQTSESQNTTQSVSYRHSSFDLYNDDVF